MPAIRRRWTTREVRSLMESQDGYWPRYELIDGELLVTPAPAGPHQTAVDELLYRIKMLITPYDVSNVLTSPADLELKPGTITQPDVFVFPLSETPADPSVVVTWANITQLHLAVEVISPSSTRMDRVTKRDFYMTAGVSEYWIVDLDARIVERWTPERETPEILSDKLEWTPPGASSPATIDVAELFDRIWSLFRRAVR